MILHPEPNRYNDTISQSNWIEVSEEEDDLPAEITFSLGDKNVLLQFQDKDFKPIDFLKDFLMMNLL